MKHTQSAHFDNIATVSHPVWRKREMKPFTCRAIRGEIMFDAMGKPEYERESYIAERLTDLDRALSDEEARALEHWLDCEELLQGCARIVDYDGGTRGSGQPSPLADDDMEALKMHAWVKRHLPNVHRSALRLLETMMHTREWNLYPLAIDRIRRAAIALTKMHR